MIIFKKMALCILSFFLCTTAMAAPSDDLTKLLLDINTMQANFTQTVKDKSARSLQQSVGNMSLERPGKFRWEIKRPSAQLIIANGSRLWIYDKDLEQVTIRTFKKAAGQTPALLLSDKNLTLSKDFNVQTTNSSETKNQFVLTPKDKEDPFESIKLTFVNKQIREMRLEDRLGHITTIAFQNVKTGNALPNSLFTFKPSANIDVIDETRNKR